MVYHACKSDGRYHRPTGATTPPRRLFVVPLIAAAVLGVSQPAANAEFNPPGPDTFCANGAVTDIYCQLSSILYNSALQLPELGGEFRFISNGHFVIGTDGARLTGDIVGGSPSAEFSVAVNFRGRMSPPTSPIIGVGWWCLDRVGGSDQWFAFTEISGELVGLPGSVYVDTRWAITKRSTDAQFGEGANTRNMLLGLFAKFNYELVDNPHNETLPVGPFAGDVSVQLLPGVDQYSGVIRPSCFPRADADLTGTWTGTIDCVGFDAEAGTGSAPAGRFFSAAVLEIGRSTNALDVGPQYSVRLTREAGNAQSFCAYVPNNPHSTTGGQGMLVEPQRLAMRVYFKFEGETLKARGLLADGLDGTQLCKWNFTRTSAAAPTVADACSPLNACFFEQPGEYQCDDNALCGQRTGCGEFWDRDGYTCTCKDGYVGRGDSYLSPCVLAP